jgi:hypothetical protein
MPYRGPRRGEENRLPTQEWRVPKGVTAEYIGVTIEGVYCDHPAWRDHPATFTFRRTPSG